MFVRQVLEGLFRFGFYYYYIAYYIFHKCVRALARRWQRARVERLIWLLARLVVHAASRKGLGRVNRVNDDRINEVLGEAVSVCKCK